MDLLWLEEHPLIDVVCTQTRLKKTAVLRSKKVEDIWSALFECWFTLYTGYQRIMSVEHELVVASDAFRNVARQTGI